MRSVFGHYCGRFRAEETKIDCGRGSDRKNLALINVVERYFFIELPGRSCRLCLGDAFGNLSASKKEFRRMCGCQCNDSLEALTSRAKTERCITTKTHTENNDCCCAVLFQAHCSRIDISKAFEITSIINARCRPTHFGSLAKNPALETASASCCSWVGVPCLPCIITK